MYICVCVNCILGVCTGACVFLCVFLCVYVRVYVVFDSQGSWHSRGNSNATAVGLATLLE